MLPLTRSRNRARFFGIPFSPSKLFAAGEQGTWYDPSDRATLFEDSAGTIPVGTPGTGGGTDPVVGLMLDKSQGLVLGPELVTNGTFDSGTTGWSAQGTNTIANVGGELEITLNSALFTGAAGTSYTLVPGKWYVATATARRGTSAANVTVRFGSGVGEGDLTFTTTSNVTKTKYFIATTTTTTPTVTTSSSSGSGTIYADNISIKALPGNHATSTGAARPTLRARYNLLTYSEQFDNGAWTKTDTTITANTVVAPDGTLTGDLLYPSSSGASRYVSQAISAASARYAISCYAKAAGKTCGFIYIHNSGAYGLMYFDLSDESISYASGSISTGTGTLTSVGNGWYRITYTIGSAVAITSGSGIGVVDAKGSVSVTANGTDGIYIWGAQLLTAADAFATGNAYQRVAAATVYDTSNPVFRPYLAGGGTQAMQTASINPGATDKAQVFAGVTKLAAGTGQLVEYSNSVSTNNGSFSMPSDSGTNTWAVGAKGTSPIVLAESATNSYTAPVTTVNGGIVDLSLASNVATLRVNGAQIVQSGAGAGGGNFGTYPLNILARQNGASIPFTGRLYSLITRFGPNLSAAEISATESWVNSRTGAF